MLKTLRISIFQKFCVTFLLLAVCSCGFQVIYKEEGGKIDNPYEQELAAIRIKKNRTKLDQDLKNSLYDLLNPDYIKAEPKYFLILTPIKTTSSTFTTSTGSSGRNRVILNVKYELQSLETGEMISFGSTLVNDNYDVTKNRFGTYTSDEYVQSNLTKVAAKNIRNSLVNDLIEMGKKKEEESEKILGEEKSKQDLTKKTLKHKKSVN